MLFKVCKISDIKENSLNKFTIYKKEILVGKINGKLFACNNTCPHRGASLDRGYYKGNDLVCYLHEYEFDVNSGKVVNMKSWKKSDTWKEQSPEWRRSGNLVMYDIIKKSDYIYVKPRSS